MKVDDFLATRPVFRIDELEEHLASRDSNNPETRDSLLRHYRNRGRIRRVRRGLYVTIPPGSDPDSVVPDPFLVGSKMAPDAVLAYHTALEFHGKSYSIFIESYALTSHRVRDFEFQGMSFKGILFPQTLVKKNSEFDHVQSHNRLGIEVRVTSLERTLVDVLDRPVLGGGWEEIWRSLEMIEYFDLDAVREYARKLDNSTTTAKLGFFLESHSDKLMVDEKYLAKLSKRVPKKPHYMDRNRRKGGRFLERWNLIVPENVINRTWEELR